jgi:hypothetical protein
VTCPEPSRVRNKTGVRTWDFNFPSKSSVTLDELSLSGPLFYSF